MPIPLHVRFGVLSEAFGRMEATSKRLELTGILTDLFEETPADTVARVVYLMQGKIRPDHEGVETGVAKKMVVRALALSCGQPVGRIEEAHDWLGDLGDAAAEMLEGRVQTTFSSEAVTVERVHGDMLEIAFMGGAGSQDQKIRHISSLMNDAPPSEARHIMRLLLGTLRLGAADHTVMDALAAAYTGDKSNRKLLERAYNVSNDLGLVAEAAALEGASGLESFQARAFAPIRPMLAERARTSREAADKGGDAAFAEYKLDGERVQVHVKKGEIVLFSRNMEKITSYYPDIVAAAPKAIAAGEAILEAEIVAMRADGSFLPFQDLLRRRRKHGLEEAVKAYPVTVNFFDALLVDGRTLIDRPYTERRAALENAVRPGGMARTVPAIRVKGPDSLDGFMENALAVGTEGLMIKSGGGPYRAGSRGSMWLKFKPDYSGVGDSLDLVVIRAFRGRGRRTGLYGALLLATYDRDADAFHSVCKVGTGFKDEDLERFHKTLSSMATDGPVARVESAMVPDAWFEPKAVIEVVAAEITLSPVHKCAMDAVRQGSGMALRFPRFTGRIRADKSPEDATTDAEIVGMYGTQQKTAGAANDQASGV